MDTYEPSRMATPYRAQIVFNKQPLTATTEHEQKVVKLPNLVMATCVLVCMCVCELCVIGLSEHSCILTIEMLLHHTG